MGSSRSPRTPALLLTALCSLLPAAAPAQEATGRTHEFLLEYRESVPGLEFLGYEEMLSREIVWEGKSAAFAELGGREVRRGAIRVGEDRVVRLARVESVGVLYPDANWNGDLSDDDPVRVTTGWSREAFATFELQAPEGGARGRWNVMLHLADGDSSGSRSAARVQSGWTGRVELAGAAYELTAIDDLDGVFTPGRDRLRWRPWTEERNAPDSVPIDLPERLVVADELYELSLRLEPGGEGGVVRATLTESSAPMVDCEIAGTHLSRLVFDPLAGTPKATAAFLERPSGTVRLPAGEYAVRIAMDDGPFDRLRSQVDIVLSPDDRNVLRAGGPLDNSLRVRRRSWSTLELTYCLRGAGGEEYLTDGNTYPDARFVALVDDREIAGGRMRYG